MVKVIFHSNSAHLSSIFYYKEPGEIVYYFSKLYGYKGILDDCESGDVFRDVCCHVYRHHTLFIHIRKILYIFIHAKEIDILYLITIIPDNLFKMLAYKFGGGKGKIYLKLDLGDYKKNGLDLLVWKNMNFFHKVGHFLFKKLPDIYTVETKHEFDRLKNTYYGDLISQKKIYRLPNGIDPNILLEQNITKMSVKSKEKLIITVGRIGSYQKNTELLLDILSDINLGGWRVCIIGGISDNFKSRIDMFYSQHPEYRNSITFLGKVDQRTLYDYYNRSRVFLLTSRYESYAFVLAEAVFMRNYIISTNVGIATELLEYSPGYIVPSQDKSLFVNELKRIMSLSDDELNSLVPEKEIKEITWEHIIKNNEVIQKLLLD